MIKYTQEFFQLPFIHDMSVVIFTPTMYSKQCLSSHHSIVYSLNNSRSGVNQLQKRPSASLLNKLAASRNIYHPGTYTDNGGMSHLNESTALGGLLGDSDSVVLIGLATAGLAVVFRLELAGEERGADGVDAAGGRRA